MSAPPEGYASTHIWKSSRIPYNLYKGTSMLIPSMILAVCNGVVVSAVRMDDYEGDDCNNPYGFKHLVDAGISFDLIDFNGMEV